MKSAGEKKVFQNSSTRRVAVIGRLVELLRRKHSLNEVAARAGLSHTMVSREEKRERVLSIDRLLRITGALDVDLGKLLGKAAKAGGSETTI